MIPFPKLFFTDLAQRACRDAIQQWRDRRKESPCPRCGTSVRGLAYMTTCIYWRDGPGWHSHDPNEHRLSFRCECGHEWDEKKRLPCTVEGCKFNEPIQTPEVP